MRWTRCSNRTTAVLVFVLLLAPLRVTAAVIVVDESCSLADAITAANTDVATGGCVAGAGADEVQLTGDVTLMEVLPVVSSDIFFGGNDFTVARNDTAPDFRIFEVSDAGSLILENTTVTGGKRVDYLAAAGGFYNRGQLVLVNTTVTGNEGIQGGGVTNLGRATLVGSTVSNNDASYGSSGGIFNGGRLYVYDSTVSGNRTGGVHSQNMATLVNSTFVGNTNDPFFSFEVYADWGSASMLITNSTVPSERGLRNAALGDYYYQSQVSNSIIFGCSGFDGLIDLGNNFDVDGSCGATPITPGIDIDMTLADNGGPTLTHALLEGSVAIDAAGDCGLEADQRGVSRNDGACDSGSFEFSQGDPCVLRVAMGSPVVQSGGELELDLVLQHNRPTTVTVPFRIWVEDREGTFIVGRTTPPITFEPGDSFHHRVKLALPESVSAGRYVVQAEIEQMQQGTVRARRQTLVVE